MKGRSPRASKPEPHGKSRLNAIGSDRESKLDEKPRGVGRAKTESGRMPGLDRRPGIADGANVIEHVESQTKPPLVTVDIEISTLLAQTVLKRSVNDPVPARRRNIELVPAAQGPRVSE